MAEAIGIDGRMTQPRTGNSRTIVRQLGGRFALQVVHDNFFPT
jgi:hypothetical protein